MVESSFRSYDVYLQWETMAYLFWQCDGNASNTKQYNDKSSSLEYTKEQTIDRTSSAHRADTGLIHSPLETQHITVVW